METRQNATAPDATRYSRRTILAAAGTTALLGAAGGATVAAAVVDREGSERVPGAEERMGPSATGHDFAWTTLGTMGGPIGSPTRSQPANLLASDDEAIVVDAGDGVVDQLIAAGIAITRVQSVVLSHLHVDHTAGLHGLLGRRLQQLAGSPLSVFGPPGTRSLVDGVMSSLQHLDGLMESAGYDTRDQQQLVSVEEVSDGSTFSVGSVDVKAVTNSHYSFSAGSKEARRFQSLSYRFGMADRTIVFTGDTGPSRAVEQLAEGADLLVTEIFDAEETIAQIRAARPELSETDLARSREHFEREHLSPENVGDLARGADVGAVVVTHNPVSDDNLERVRARVAQRYSGSVWMAEDLDVF